MLCRVPHAVCVPHVVFLPGIPQQLSYPENAIHARVAVVVAENDDEDVGDDGDPHRPPRRRRIASDEYSQNKVNELCLSDSDETTHLHSDARKHD